MLQVLGRSATGQNLTVYTNIITGPGRSRRARRRPTAPTNCTSCCSTTDAAKVLGSELAEILYCIRCGACLNACPVYQQIGGHAYGSVYPGPVGAVLTPALSGHRGVPRPAAREHPLRRVQGGLPGADRHPALLLRAARQRRAAKVAHLDGSHRASACSACIGLPALALFRIGRPLAAMATGILAKNGWISRLPGPLAGLDRVA